MPIFPSPFTVNTQISCPYFVAAAQAKRQAPHVNVITGGTFLVTQLALSALLNSAAAAGRNPHVLNMSLHPSIWTLRGSMHVAQCTRWPYQLILYPRIINSLAKCCTSHEA
jgi:hypothetical protein